MALFSAFNNISNAISSASQNFNSFSNSISSFSNGLSNSSRNFLQSTPLGANISRASNTLASLDSMFASTASAFNVGSATRMASNALQGVSSGANPSERSTAVAVAAADVSSNRNDSAGGNDWRVSLSVPSEIQNQGILKPLSDLNNRMVFPINPTVMLQHSANYSEIAPTHSNYAFHAYQSSKVDDITLMGEFYIENEQDAAYWLACVHFLRTMTKMFYGSGSHVGNPPLLSHLNGYGKYVLNDIPVLIKNFQIELGTDIDYLPVTVAPDPNPNYVPTRSTITVTTTPNYARTTVSKFNLKTFSEGGFVNKPEGFV
jgi:hypothetical protein|tara:strand:+ start:696 stop:1646 length:951 start_codon:yes stop_codon:yes gene_type:complete